MNSFNDFINRLYSLCTEEAFRREIEKYIDHHDSNIVKYIDRERGRIELYVTNSDHLFEEDVINTSMQSELLNETKRFREYPSEIMREYSNQRLKVLINKWMDKLEKAESISSREPYLKNFPEYFESLRILKKTLKEIRLSLKLEKGSRGIKNTLGPNEQARIILHSEELLSEDPTKYAPKNGATVSESLKHATHDDLKESIPKISFHKVARILFKHYQVKNQQVI